MRGLILPSRRPLWHPGLIRPGLAALPLRYDSFQGGGAQAPGGGGADPFFDEVVMLTAFDGADAATTATDDSAAAHALSFAGNAQLDTDQKQFGTASLLCDGTGDWVTAPDGADWVFAGPFTVECWVRPTNTVAAVRGILSHFDTSTNWGWSLHHTSTTLTFQFTTTGSGAATFSIAQATAVAAASWVHVAADRDGSDNLRLYSGGSMIAKQTGASGATFNTSGTLNVGRRAASQPYNGHIDEVRITKGIARYASDAGYSVPTEAFPRS